MRIIFAMSIETLPVELAATKRKWLTLCLNKTPCLRPESFI